MTKSKRKRRKLERRRRAARALERARERARGRESAKEGERRGGCPTISGHPVNRHPSLGTDSCRAGGVQAIRPRHWLKLQADSDPPHPRLIQGQLASTLSPG